MTRNAERRLEAKKVWSCKPVAKLVASHTVLDSDTITSHLPAKLTIPLATQLPGPQGPLVPVVGELLAPDELYGAELAPPPLGLLIASLEI